MRGEPAEKLDPRHACVSAHTAPGCLTVSDLPFRVSARSCISRHRFGEALGSMRAGLTRRGRVRCSARRRPARRTRCVERPTAHHPLSSPRHRESATLYPSLTPLIRATLACAVCGPVRAVKHEHRPRRLACSRPQYWLSRSRLLGHARGRVCDHRLHGEMPPRDPSVGGRTNDHRAAGDLARVGEVERWRLYGQSWSSCEAARVSPSRLCVSMWKPDRVVCACGAVGCDRAPPGMHTPFPRWHGVRVFVRSPYHFTI